MTAWTDHVTKFFNENRLKNPEYTFKQALKEAGKTFNKGTRAVTKGVENTVKAAEKMVSTKKTHKRRTHRKSRKGKKSHRKSRKGKKSHKKKSRKSRK
jgi:hypothetical protein